MFRKMLLAGVLVVVSGNALAYFYTGNDLIEPLRCRVPHD